VALVATSLTSPIMLTTLRPETNVTNDPGGMALSAVNAIEAPTSCLIAPCFVFVKTAMVPVPNPLDDCRRHPVKPGLSPEQAARHLKFQVDLKDNHVSEI